MDLSSRKEGKAMKREAAPRRRLPPAERRRQVIDAVLRVVAEHGIPGATIARVADSAAVGIGTIYRYFDDQEAMLRSAVETISEEMTRPIFDSFNENAIEHIRAFASEHHALVAANGGEMARLWLEFVAANPQVGLHNTIRDTQIRAFRAIRDVCERGVRQGTIRPDIDSEFLAFRIMEQAWGADMSALMGFDEFLGRDCSREILEHLLQSAVNKG
jgi:AcrR family transcriptional regulator